MELDVNYSYTMRPESQLTFNSYLPIGERITTQSMLADKMKKVNDALAFNL